MFDETALLEKLRKIEALHVGATTEGERLAAAVAAERIRERLLQWRARLPDVELVYTIHDPWSRMLFVALCRRYGLKPVRYARQRQSTLCVSAPQPFHDNSLWPQFRALSDALEAHLRAVTEHVIHLAIHDDATEAPVVDAPPGLRG